MGEANLSRYALIEEIGQGGMGTVYRATDTKLLREVAIKVLRPELVSMPGYVERFRREAYAAARLSEPHIVPVYEADDTDGQLFIVMPLIDGVDLNVVLARDGAMTPERAIHVVDQVGAALDAAHSSGLVHRDVKPPNILVTARDFAYLIDFGIANADYDTKLTATGTTVGTWGYMAPERFTTGVADERGDTYALACVLYQCLTGIQPFAGNGMPQQVHGHCYLAPPRPTSMVPTLPSAFDEVVTRGMAKDPDQRYQTCHELVEAARHALTAPEPAADVHGARRPPALPLTMPAALYNEQLHQAQTKSASPQGPPPGRPSELITPPHHRSRGSKIGLLAGAAAVVAGMIGATFALNARDHTTGTAAPGPKRAPASCHIVADPMADIAVRTDQEPRLRIPVPPGWHRSTRQDGQTVVLHRLAHCAGGQRR